MKLKSIFDKYEKGSLLHEIRIRVGQPLIVRTSKGEYGLDENGYECSIDNSYRVTPKDIKEIMEFVSGYSPYAYEEELRNGYITIPGGNRIGICGKTITDVNGIKTIKNISSINIPNKVESIGESAMRVYFKQGTHIKESLQLPHTLTHLGDYAFITWDISSIYAKMPTPPAITEWTFGLTNSMANTPVYVYHENINSYYQANVWKQFDIISAYKVVYYR